MNKNIKIIFMGTPDFAVESLKKIIANNYNVVAVITAPDKPAGRGKKIKQSAVKKFALANNLKILQPTNLKSTEFINQIKKINPDLQIVVAFRMLPEKVWTLPKLGTFNLHASLLPNYRGAAPINWAIINGEKKTGITTFFLDKEIDTGKIIMQKQIEIKETYNAEDLHNILMTKGADLVVDTIKNIIENKIQPIEQKKLITKNLKTAPKIHTNDCKIQWNNTTEYIYNFIRGLSPYPSAWTEFITYNGKILRTKIFKVKKEVIKHNYKIGKVLSDDYSYIKIAVKDGFINLLELQIAGKNKNNINDFIRGFKSVDNIKIKNFEL